MVRSTDDSNGMGGEGSSCCARRGDLRRAGAIAGLASAGAFLTGLAVAGAQAGLEPDELDDEAKAAVRLLSPVTSVSPGQVVELGFEFEIERGWHLYWDGRNDTGFAPQVSWEVPAGFEPGAIAWPTPERYVLPGGILDHIYEDRVTLLVPVRVPDDAAVGGTVELAADVEWLVCKDVCIPEFGRASVTLPVTASAGSASSAAGRLASARGLVPVAAGDEVRADWSGELLVLGVEGAGRMEFYPSRDSAEIEDLIAHGAASTGELRLPVDRASAEAVAGIVRWWPSGGGSSISRTVRVTTGAGE